MVINMELTHYEKELIERGYDQNKVIELSSYDMDYVYKVRDFVVETLTKGCTKEETPIAMYIGGQPGTGKSVKLREIKNSWKDNNVICIIGLDNYRIYHPNYKEIEDVINEKWKDKKETIDSSKGNDMAAFTSDFASIVTDLIIDKITDHKYNLAIEWGMRSPLVPLETMEKLHNKGYKNIVKFIVVDKETSKEACTLRDNIMNEHDIILRRIPNYFHEDAINSLPYSSEQIYIEGFLNKKIIDEFSLIDRDNNILWDSSSDKKLTDTYNYYLNNKVKDYKNNPEYAVISFNEETNKKRDL
jgi:hypothetical protein